VILAAGLTPAWQQIMVFEGLGIGKVNRACESWFCSSGKILNVGLALHHLGRPSLTLSILGGRPGENIDREICSLGMEHRWIWAQKPTRICTTIVDRLEGSITELVENAGPVDEEELERFLGAYQEVVRHAGIVILIGSLPAQTPRTLYCRLIEQTPARVVLDASGPELLAALRLRPFCVKPNREELARTLGREIRSDDELKDALREIHDLGARWAIVSNGRHPLWASFEGNAWIFHPPRISAVNPIASGDCLAAGLAWAVDSGMDMLEAIRFGMAAAAENAAALLPSRLDLRRVRERMGEVRFEAAP
jgi:tagatose 6-phosphate kinase